MKPQPPVDLHAAGRRNTDRATIVDRLPPSSIEAEAGVLGCVLLSPNDCMGECVEKLKPGADVFYDLRHQTIFQTLVEMYDNQAGIDVTTVMQRLRDQKQLELVGGLAYLASLPDAVPSAAGLAYYLDIVLDKYLLRKMIQTCTSIVGRVFEHEGQVDALLDEAERDILKISDTRQSGIMPTIQQLVIEASNDMETAWKNKGKPAGILTGFTDLDRLTKGFKPGEMAVIAARPSVGKTSLATNIVEHVAVDQKIPTGVFSLEMTGRQLTTRLIASRARINMSSTQDGDFKVADFPKMTAANTVIARAPLCIDDTSNLSILRLRAKARRMQQAHGIKLLVIDYLQLLNSTSRRVENRQQEIADISGGIKALAKELGIPIIVLSQLNRDLEKRKGDRPRLYDLRESGAIEQDADFVGLLYKVNDKSEEASKETDCIQVNMAVDKQRNGPTGNVEFTFLKTYTRFEQMAKVEKKDIPTESPRYGPDDD